MSGDTPALTGGAEAGRVSPSEHTSYRDRATGALVHQMTAHPSINHATYFLESSFAPGEETLLFVSYRNGSAQLFEAGFPDGDIRQLTGSAGIHPFSAAYHPSGKTIFFVRGGEILELDRATLIERSIVRFENAQLGEVSLD